MELADALGLHHVVVNVAHGDGVDGADGVGEGGKTDAMRRFTVHTYTGSSDSVGGTVYSGCCNNTTTAAAEAATTELPQHGDCALPAATVAVCAFQGNAT